MLNQPTTPTTSDAPNVADQQGGGAVVPRPIPGYPNLRPYPKGQSGNPTGRRTDLVLAALRKEVDQPTAERLVKVVVARALSGDLDALKMIWDRLEGKPIARTEDGAPGSFTGIKILRGVGVDDL